MSQGERTTPLPIPLRSPKREESSSGTRRARSTDIPTSSGAALPAIPRAGNLPGTAPTATAAASPNPVPPLRDDDDERGSYPSLSDIQVDIDSVQPASDGPSIRPSWAPRRGRRFGRYELLGRFASGGMADIYLAREHSQGGATRLVVVKVVKPSIADDSDFMMMFQDEGRLVLRLNHPNIAHVYEYGVLDGRHFLGMEWVNGQSLARVRKHLAEQGRTLPIPIAVKLAAKVAEALDYAHRARDERGRLLGVVHRDVSPHNIVISYDGQVKLLDFGVAKARSRMTTTQAGVVRGKFAYMSPQQCLGMPLDGRSDLFSLGAVLHELLTGKPLYERGVEFETMKQIIEGPILSPRELNPAVPLELEAIVLKALAKEPVERYATSSQMLEALETYLVDSGTQVRAAHIEQLMRSEFAAEHAAGPPLETGTELLQLLPVWGEPEEVEEEDDSVVVRPRPESRGTRLFVAFGILGALAAVVMGIALFADPFSLAAPGSWADRVSSLGSPGADEATPTTGQGSPVVVGGEPAASDGVPGEPAARTPDADDDGVSGDARGESQPAAAGAVRIVTTPEAARVFIDGEPVDGRTPLEVGELSPGPHELTVRLVGHATLRQEVTVVAGETADVEVTLEEAEATPAGTLAINTRPWSRVYAGSRSLGTTPIARARVPSGTVRLRLVDGSGNQHRRSVRVAPGAHESVFYDLSAR